MKLGDLIATLWFLQSRSVINSLTMRAKRLKQPKYLIGAVVGAGYFWMIAFRHLFAPSRPGPGGDWSMPHDAMVLVEACAALLLVFFVVLNWVFTSDRASLRFSEAEVAFLFPAPLSRRSLIHFRLLRSQLGILFSAAFFSLVTGRAVNDSHWFIHLLAWWLVLATLNLHGIAASFAVQRLTERGMAGWRRRTLVLAVVCGLVAGVVWWAKVAPAAESLHGAGDAMEYTLGLLAAGPLPWLLAPFRWMVRPWFAVSALEFLQVVWPALLLLVAHYWWVLRSDVSFEEATIEASRRTAERLAAARSGNWQAVQKPKRAKRAPFRLAPVGFPPLALLWKNLLSAGQMFTARLWIILLSVSVSGMMVAQGFFRGHEGARPFQGVFAVFFLALLVMSSFLGPQLLRNDFRSDLPNMDLLKALPLPGWQIALGQLLGPVAILAGFQWLLLVLVLGLSSGMGDEIGLRLVRWRWPGGLSLMIVLPFLDFLLLAMPNAAVLLFPAWTKGAAGQGGGVEVMGQRLIFVLGQALVLGLALLPGLGVGALVWWLVQMAIGPTWAVPFGAVVAALVLAGECAVAVWALGLAFARFDVSEER
jgi:ABC-2 type transport system permease protein